jgi:hypothetical protein
MEVGKTLIVNAWASLDVVVTVSCTVPLLYESSTGVQGYRAARSPQTGDARADRLRGNRSKTEGQQQGDEKETSRQTVAHTKLLMNITGIRIPENNTRLDIASIKMGMARRILTPCPKPNCTRRSLTNVSKGL